jgi:hypothetical protein
MLTGRLRNDAEVSLAECIGVCQTDKKEMVYSEEGPSAPAP